MFENFSFQPKGEISSTEPSYSPSAIQDTEVSPFFGEQTIERAPALTAWDLINTPPSSPPEFNYAFQSRKASISLNFENMSLSDRRTTIQSTFDLNDKEEASEEDIVAQQNSIRFQRQLLSRMHHNEDFQRKCLADLLQDMVADQQSCSVKLASKSPKYPTPPSSVYDGDLSEIEYSSPVKVTKDVSFRKSWTYGAVPPAAVNASVSRAGIQKKVRVRRSLGSLSGDRIRRVRK